MAYQDRIIYYCPVCDKVFFDFSTKKYNPCPDCKVNLFKTDISEEQWKEMSVTEHDQFKKTLQETIVKNHIDY